MGQILCQKRVNSQLTPYSKALGEQVFLVLLAYIQRQILQHLLFIPKGKTLSNVIGDFAGNTLGTMMYGDGSAPALTEKELQAIKDGLDINKPINGRKKRNAGREIIGYQPRQIPQDIAEINAFGKSKTGYSPR